MPRRPLILYDRRTKLGRGGTDQLRLYLEKPASRIGTLSASPGVISAVLNALEAAPHLRVQSVDAARSER